MFKFDKVGERIKNWAKGIFIVETIAGIISGIVIMFGGAELILIGILVALGAVFVGYLTSLPIYGFGVLILLARLHKLLNKDNIIAIKQIRELVQNKKLSTIYFLLSQKRHYNFIFMHFRG